MVNSHSLWMLILFQNKFNQSLNTNPSQQFQDQIKNNLKRSNNQLILFIVRILTKGYPYLYQLIYQMKLAFLGALLIAVGLADSCGGNCPSGKCTNCFCGNTKLMQDIGSWCSKYSWDQACCKCIVSHESGGNAHAMNYNSNGSTDVGLWQINNINWGQCNNGHAPCDPTQNLNCAIKVYQWGGSTWKAWSTHAACGC